MERPLVTDHDDRDGMSRLFEVGDHYLSHKSDAELANNIEWCIREPSLAASMAKRAYQVAYDSHQVKNRVEQIMEVCGV
jgi:spore maturation protein CgeB